MVQFEMVVSYWLSIVTMRATFGCNLLSNAADGQITLLTLTQNLENKGFTDVNQMFA